MNPAPTWRLLGLLGLAVALAGVGPVLLERERAVAAQHGRAESVSAVGAPLAVLAFLAIFPISGVPLGWITHLRVAVTADGIGQGLSTLPGDPRSLQRDQPVGADGDPAGRGGAAARRRAAAGLRAAGRWATSAGPGRHCR